MIACDCDLHLVVALWALLLPLPFDVLSAEDWCELKPISENVVGTRDDNSHCGRKTEADKFPFAVAYVGEAEGTGLPRKDFDDLAEVLGLDKLIDMVGYCNSILGRGA